MNGLVKVRSLDPDMNPDDAKPSKKKKKKEGS
jgi:hypothetical protein